MHLWIFNHRLKCRSEGLHHLILRLPARPYSGMVGETAPTTVSLHPPSVADGFCPLGLLFLKGVFQTPWYFGENLRTPLHSWGSPFRFLMSDVFQRRLQSCQQIFFPCPFRTNYWFFASIWSTNNIGSLYFCSRFDLFLHSHMAGFFRFLLIPKGSLFFWGPKILGGTDPRLWEMSSELFPLPFCFVVQWWRRYLGISSLLPDRLSLVAVFPIHSIEEERIK